MKKIVSILIIFLAIGFIAFGSSYFMKNNDKIYNTSEEKNTEEKSQESHNDDKKEKVKMYLFWGNGCPHCEEAKEWLEEIDPTYKELFEVVSYEVWYDEENALLMTRVGDYLGEDATGVPFIVIGSTAYKGFAEPYKEKILNTIIKEYSKNERIDVVKIIENND